MPRNARRPSLDQFVGPHQQARSAVAWLDELGVLKEDVALGHAIWVTEADIDLLAARGASVTNSLA
jgi:cytosine/adenosine deaminase-related metal-dependent hydrolase